MSHLAAVPRYILKSKKMMMKLAVIVENDRYLGQNDRCRVIFQ